MRRRRSALSAALVLALSSLVVPTAMAAPSDQAVATEMAAGTTGYGQDSRRTYQPLQPVRRDAMAAFIFRTVTDPTPEQNGYEPSATPLS